MALFAQMDSQGQLRLVNHLGVSLGEQPEQILARLERCDYTEADIEYGGRRGSDSDYARHVREVDADTPARFNADVTRLHEASGSAGKLVLFAVRLDTFPAQTKSAVFYIGTNSTDELTAIRRHVLAHFKTLPVSGEYLHRDAFDIAEKYGKDMFLLIRWLGTTRLPFFFALKSRCDEFFGRLGFMPSNLSDRILQALSRLFPGHLPKRMKDFRNRYPHHLLLKVAGPGIEEAQQFLATFFPTEHGDYFQCTDSEGTKAFLHRFAAAGAAVRYRAIHRNQVEDIVALDIALKRNECNWFEQLPTGIDQQILLKLYYGHFLCHVFHQDYIVYKGNDCVALEHRMLKLLDARGAEYPAEHNVGHLYTAKPVLRDFYRELDPTNSFNPGIGKTSKCRHWSTASEPA
jgi:D-lactate dehydrogenase